MADSSLSDLEVTTVGEDNNDALLLLRPTAGKGDFFIVGELVHLIRIFAKMDDDSRLAGAIFVNCRDAAVEGPSPPLLRGNVALAVVEQRANRHSSVDHLMTVQLKVDMYERELVVICDVVVC